MSVSFLPNGWWKNLGEALVTVVWIVGVTNAYNFLDGLDGLAAGSAAINFFFFFTILYSTARRSARLGQTFTSLLPGDCTFRPNERHDAESK